MHRSPLSDALVVEIATDIIAGRLPAGTMLPPEPQLCAQFGVSRTVVREATAQLQRMGLVRIRQGHGTGVLDRSHWHELDPELLRVRASAGLIQDLVSDLLGVRRIVEVEVAGHVALHRSEADLARLAELIDAMHTAGNAPVAQTDIDIAFHEALIDANGNRLLQQMMRPINLLRRVGSIMTTSSNPRIIALSIAGHQAIFGAVAAGDAAAARAAMASHITQFERDLLVAMTATGTQRLNHVARGASDAALRVRTGD